MSRDNPPEGTLTETSTATSAQDAKRAARRRLLLGGAKIAPVVVATLASRPSLACHCVMPSAWGSVNVALGGADQDMGQNGLVNRLTGSMQRYGGVIKTGFSPYNIPVWTSGDSAWLALAGKFTAYPHGLTTGLSTTTAKNARKVLYLKGLYSSASIPALTVGALCTAIGVNPPTGSNGNQPLATIQGGGFKASVLVAEFNVFLGLIPTDCLTRSILNEMASGYYLPAGVAATDAWTSGNGQIADYLHNNWVARRT